MIATREPRRADRQLAWVWFGVAVAAPLLAWAWVRVGLGTPGCAFHRLTGVPCPTCGSSRAVVAALQGHLVEAFLWNPLVTTLIGLFEIGGLIAPAWFALGGRVPVFGPSLPRWIRWAILTALLANWAWLIARGV